MKNITIMLASIALSATTAASGTSNRSPAAQSQDQTASFAALVPARVSSPALAQNSPRADAIRNWTKTWGGSGNDPVHNLAVDGSGNTYVIGEFVGTVDFDPDPANTDVHSSTNGTIDAFLSKFAPDGRFLWARTWGGGPAGGSGFSGRDVPNGVAVDRSGNVYVSGPFQYTVDFNPAGGAIRTSNAGSMNNIFLSKFTPEGTFVWVQTWGPSDGGAESYSIAMDASDHIYVVGDYSGSGCYFNNTWGQPPADWHANHPASPGQPRFFDAFLSKFDSNGNFVWAKTWGGEGYDDGPGVAVDGSGNVYVSGMYASKTIDFDPAGGGVTDHPAQDSGYVTDVFLSKFDSSGNFLWVRTWGGQGAIDSAETVTVDGANNVYVAGRFESTSCDFNPGGPPDIHGSHGSADAFVSKFDSGGTFQWARTWGGTGADGAGSVAVDGANHTYVSGYFTGTATFDPPIGTTIATSNGQADVFVIRLGPSGTFEGAMTWGGAGDDWAYHVAMSGADKMFVVGGYQSTVDFDPGSGVDNRTSHGGSDAFVSLFLISVAAPTVTAVVPSGGKTEGGTAFTVTGTGFTAGTTTVTVGGNAATGLAVQSGTALTATTAAHAAGIVDVVVTTAGGVFTASGTYTYMERPSFTDDPLVIQATQLKGTHVTELRAALGALRERFNLGAVAWTDPIVAAGTTSIRAVHVAELRDALTQVYAAAARSAPVYSHPTLIGGTSTIAAVDIAEIRTAVLAIW